MILIMSNAVYEKSVRYDQICPVDLNTNKDCEISLTIEEDVTGPLYFYYRINVCLNICLIIRNFIKIIDDI